jgi:hypothetical protein
MTRCTSVAPLGSEFDSFLFAPIGEDRNGMLLSVLSALARSDVDPWQEADELARLPREAAIARLALLIAPLPDGLPTRQDLGTITDRLIALLPRQGSSNVPSSTTLLGVGEGTNSRAVVCVFFILMALTMGAQVFMASRVPQAQLDNAPTRASSTVAPPSPGVIREVGLGAN